MTGESRIERAVEDVETLHDWLTRHSRRDVDHLFGRPDPVQDYDAYHTWLFDRDPDEEEPDFHLTVVQLKPLSLHLQPGPAELLVLFTPHADEILASGLHGARDHERLGMTLKANKEPGGWNFAYRALDGEARGAAAGRSPSGDTYGDRAFVFAAPHCLAWHWGDGEQQALFRGDAFDPTRAIQLVHEEDWEGLENGEEPEDLLAWRAIDPATGEMASPAAETWDDAVRRAADLFAERFAAPFQSTENAAPAAPAP